MRASPIMMAALALLAAAPAGAEVQKFINICGGSDQGVRLCPSFALTLTPPQGWMEDKAASRQNGVQVLVPQGRDFGNAEAVIYVKVSYHQDRNQSLTEFVRVSQERWRKAVPDTKISTLAEQARAGGKSPFLMFEYENPSRPQQTHERVAFGLDSDKDANEYVLMVVMTGRSKKALERTSEPYNAFLRAH